MADSGGVVLGGQGQQHVEPFGTNWPATFTNHVVVAEAAAVKSEPPAAPPGRDARWMAAFMSEATDKLRRRAQRYANRRAHAVAQYGGRVDSEYGADLVDDVLADTLSGKLSWRPDVASPVSLEDHVLSAIRSRSRHDRNRAKMYPHVTLEPLGENDDDEQARAVVVEADEALAVTMAASEVERAFFAAEVVAQLRALADGDGEVVAMIDAMSRGATERADLMQALAMNARTYDRVRHRLDRLVQQLQ
jgi:hypothetical protein